MSKPRKYWHGEVITSLDEIDQLWREAQMKHQQSSCFVMVGQLYDGQIRVIPENWPSPRPCHIAWVLNQPYAYLKRRIASGWIRHAEITPAYKEWLHDELRQIEVIKEAA